MILHFNTHGNEKQKDCVRAWLDPNISEIIYGGSKGSAKSFTGVSLIFGDAFINPETNYFIARKQLNDLRKFTIPSIHEVFKIWGITSDYYQYNGQDNYFRLHNESKVFLLDAAYQPSDPLYERFGSIQMTRGWIEEAGQFEEAAKNNLAASIGRWKNKECNLPGKLLQTCNPSKNYLYKDYKNNKEGKLESWKRFIQALPSDNKMLQPGYLDNLNRTLTGNQKERLLKGNWEYDDDPATMIDYEKILEMFTNDFSELKGVKYITADVARFGSDKCVIGMWDGFRLIHIKTFAKSSITDSYDYIDRLRKDNTIPVGNILCDEDGVGGGLVDMLKCKGFLNGSKPLKDEKYTNLQSQMAYKLAEQINKGKMFIDPKCLTDPTIKPAITEELEQLKRKDVDIDGNFKMGIVPKDDVKKLLGRSPDYRDMLLMRMWFEYKSTLTIW